MPFQELLAYRSLHWGKEGAVYTSNHSLLSDSNEAHRTCGARRSVLCFPGTACSQGRHKGSGHRSVGIAVLLSNIPVSCMCDYDRIVPGLPGLGNLVGRRMGCVPRSTAMCQSDP